MNNHSVAINILSDRPIAYHPDLARIAGGVKAGIFLSQLFYWKDRGARGDGFVWKTQADFELETALTRKEQESARRVLKSRGLIQEKLQGVPAKLHYKINSDEVGRRLSDLYESVEVEETEEQTAVPEAEPETHKEMMARKKQEARAKKIKEQKKAWAKIEEQDPEFVEYLKAWNKAFPDKRTHPAGTAKVVDCFTLWSKVADKLDFEFLDVWRDAIEIASKNSKLVEEGWFNISWMLKNNRKFGWGFLRIINGEWDSWNQNGRSQSSPQQQTNEKLWREFVEPFSRGAYSSRQGSSEGWTEKEKAILRFVGSDIGRKNLQFEVPKIKARFVQEFSYAE